jgi:hypothetical protein
VRDKKLLWMIALLTVFVTAHNIDHFVRDGVSLPLVIVVGVIYALIGVVLFLYWKNKVGARFFTVAAVAGFAFGWLGHFSPFTDQPPAYILAAYRSAWAGWLALSSLFGIMLVLAAIAVYCSYQLSRR